MNSTLCSLYAAAMALCLFSNGIIRGKKTRTRRPFACFTFFLTVEALGFVFEILMVHPATPLKSLWLGLRMGTSLLIAPSLWRAVKESIDENLPRLVTLGRGHFIVILVGIGLLLPLIVNANLGHNYSDPQHLVSPWHSRAIHGTMLACIAIFAVQAPFYLWRCHRLLQDNRGASQWLRPPVAAVLTAWVLGLLRTLQCISHAPRELDLVFAAADVGVTAGAIFLLVRCGWFMDPAEATAGGAESPTPTGSKYARSSLNDGTSERIRRKLQVALATGEIYRDSLLSLRSLSREINEKAHYVSQVINQDLESNFYELVNRHRIERAKKLLTEAPEKTVLEVALEVGFNSKSTFNTAFRHNTGMTPREYRARKNQANGTG